MASRQMAPSAGPAANDRVRMNMQQVREQQELNRERKAQQESAAERNAAAREKTKSQYAHVSSRVSAATSSAIAGGAAAAGSGRGAATALRGLQQPSGGKQQSQPEDDVKITVFVRECDPDGGVFSIFESEVLKQQQAALAQAAGGGGGAAAAARGPSAAAPGARNSARAPSNAPPAAAAAAAGRPAPVAFGRGPATTSRAQPAAPTTPLQPLPQNTTAGFVGGAPPAAQRGAVPDYLKQRKQQLQDEKDRVAKAIEDEKTRAQYPPGHRPLAEEERQAILSKLASRKKELEADLGRLPLRFDTIAVKNRRQEIMGEMNEVDEAVQKFSVKKQLFVPI